MRTKLLMILAAGTVLAAAGCAQMEQKKDLLSAAGFRVKSADSGERLKSLQGLPPHKLVREDLNGREVWVYADPDVCNCLYVGTPDEYQRYQRLSTRREIAQDRLAAAQMSRMGPGYGGMWPGYGGIGPGYGVGGWGAGPYGWGAWGPWGI